MEIEIVWTKRAEKDLSATIDYLEKEWTKNVIEKNSQVYLCTALTFDFLPLRFNLIL